MTNSIEVTTFTKGNNYQLIDMFQDGKTYTFEGYNEYGSANFTYVIEGHRYEAFFSKVDISQGIFVDVTEAPKAQVKSILIHWSENNSFKDGQVFNSFEEMNDHIMLVQDTFPKMGYDKTKYTITWDDAEGSEYSGRLDLTHVENEFYRIEDNRINLAPKIYLEYLLTDESPYTSDEIKKQAQEMLETLTF